MVFTNEVYAPKLISDLTSLGHHAFVADDGLTGEDVIRSPDLILVDVHSPEADPSQTCRTLRDREATRQAPILLMVGEDQVKGLDFSFGMDDFLVKPYDLREVEARIRLMLWRDDRVDETGILKVGDILINLTRYEVRVRGARVELTLKEYELLKHLVMNRSRVFTRGDLLNQIWGYNYYGGMRTVDVHIRRVRSKLEGAGDSYIKTIRGVGYKFELPSGEDNGV